MEIIVINENLFEKINGNILKTKDINKDTQLEINFDVINEKEKILKLKLEEAEKKINKLIVYTDVLEANNKRLEEENKSLEKDNKKLKDAFDYYYSKYLSMKNSIENIKNYLNI